MNQAKTPTSILIIEDDAVLRSAYETVLTIEGFDVAVAGDGQEAIAITNEREFDVMLLDMLMPNLNGVEFLRAFQPKVKHPHTKIIIFSNMSVPSDVKEAIQLGATKYLTKSSFTPKEMITIIEEIVAGE